MKRPSLGESVKAHPYVVLLVLALGLFTLLAVPAIGLASIHDSTSGRVLQVDLAKMSKISQFDDINSSLNGYGKNACGLVAAAAATGGSAWVSTVQEIAQAAGNTYSPDSGIQPSDYVNALGKVYGAQNVKSLSAGTLSSLYDELSKGNIVIVDLKVNENTDMPSTQAPNFAHFARVVGMDMNAQEIYIQNTLRGATYWTVTFQEFSQTWEQPETTASDIPDTANAEDVTRWAVVLDSSLANDQDM